MISHPPIMPFALCSGRPQIALVTTVMSRFLSLGNNARLREEERAPLQVAKPPLTPPLGPWQCLASPAGGCGPWYDANVRHDKGPPCTTRPLNAKTREIRQVNNSRRPIFLCASPHHLPSFGFPFRLHTGCDRQQVEHWNSVPSRDPSATPLILLSPLLPWNKTCSSLRQPR
jgi:hypothetical protein